MISSLKFNLTGSLLYLGCVNGRISVIDLEVLRPIRSFKQQLGRVGCMDNTEEWGLVAGSHDTSVVHYDLRLKSPSVLKLVAHRQEVCGVSARLGRVASGSNDG
jgi:WD40 repeat protein